MDETYIKMCDCPEIQKGHEIRDGERYAFRVANGDWHNMTFCSACDDGLPVVEVWLPRQEDIQEMYKKYIDAKWKDPPWGIGDIEDQFHIFFIEGCYCKEMAWSHSITEHTENWTEIWLAFYMHETHNKTWTDEGWH